MIESFIAPSKISSILKEYRTSFSSYWGYFSSYFPIELLYGFNVHPVRILGHNSSNAQNRILDNYVCSYLADIVTNFELGHFKWADGVIIPATCDSLYAIKDHLAKSEIESILFNTPLKFDVKNYPIYRNSTEKIMMRINISHEFRNDLFEKALLERNLLRSKIISLISAGGEPFRGSLFLKLMLAKLLLPYHAVMSLLESVDQDNINLNYHARRENIILLGPLCDNLKLVDYINRHCNVITGLLASTIGPHCCEIPEGLKTKENLIRFYFDRVGTATAYGYFQRFMKQLDAEIIKYDVKSLIYLNYKSCEPHMFFARRLKSLIKDTNVKMLYLEYEHSLGMEPLMENKIDIFLENL